MGNFGSGVGLGCENLRTGQRKGGNLERPIYRPVGTPVEDLDTPALVVDLEVMDRNIEVLHAYFRRSDVNVRPHVASHQCPQIAHRQLESGGTVGGISVTTVGEAEVFRNAGIGDILVASEIVTPSKIQRLCALAGRTRVTVSVDNPQNVDDLSEAAEASEATLQVVVELDVGLGRCGVLPGQPALELARRIVRSTGLNFAGLMAIPPTAPVQSGDSLVQNSEGGRPVSPDSATRESETRESETRRLLQLVLDTRELIERDGLPVSMVSVGGTHNYDVAGRMSGITEVQAGSYPLMDYNYCQLRPEFTQAAKVLAQVISHPVDQRAVLDAGHKATGPDRGMPLLEGFPGARATRFSAEHGILELEGESRQQFNPGDKAWLLPLDLELCLNQYDYIRAVRNGKLVGFWPLAGRGRFG